MGKLGSWLKLQGVLEPTKGLHNFKLNFLYRRRAWLFCDLRSVPEAGRPREQVKILGRACTRVLLLPKAELGFFHFLEIVTGWLVPSAG
jgi:hypothetical protein